MPPKKVVSPSRRCAGRVCGPELPLGPGHKVKQYAAERCARACAEGSNLCTYCGKYQEAYMSGKPEMRAMAAKFHGRFNGAIPPGSHIAGSEWSKKQDELAAAALLAAQRAAEAAEAAAGAAAEAGAAAAGGGGGKAKVKAKAKVAKEEAAVAAAAAERAASSAGSLSSETKWRIAAGRAFASISRGANVAQIARAEEKEAEKALREAQAAEKRAAAAAIKAAAAAAGAKAAAAAAPAKTRKAGRKMSPIRIYTPASDGYVPSWMNFMRTPPSAGRRSRRASPAAARRSTSSRRGSPAAAPAAAVPSGTGALEAEIEAALGNLNFSGYAGGSILDRNAI